MSDYENNDDESSAIIADNNSQLIKCSGWPNLC